MPPKRTKRSKGTSSKTNEPIETNTVSLQTESVHTTETEDYRKQVKLLLKEIENYKIQILALQNENNFLKNQISTAGKIILSNDVANAVLSSRSSLKGNNEKIASPGPKGKGCSCKGNCSNKICGCVKKGIICQEFCRCDDAHCKNQEPNKENIEQEALSNDGQKALEKFGRLTLNQESLHASEKKAKRGIFSPFGNSNGLANRDASYCPSPLTFEVKRKLFTQNSDDLVDIDTDATQEADSVTEPKHLESIENLRTTETVQSIDLHTPIIRRTRRKIIDQNIDGVQDHKIESSPQKLESKKIKEKHFKKSQQALKKEINAQDVDHIKVPTMKIKNSNLNDNKKVDFDNVTDQNVANLPKVLRKKSKSVSPTRHVSRRRYGDKVASKNKAKSISPSDHKNFQKELKLPKVIHSPQNVNINDIHEKNKDQLAVPTLTIESPPQLNQNKSSISFESNDSGGSSHNVLDMSLNPMVPKRQLPRSPINTAGNVIMPIENKRFSPPKKELAVEEVDWEQHQSELVPCEQCKRKFFPFRIDIHKKSCKGV